MLYNLNHSDRSIFDREEMLDKINSIIAGLFFSDNKNTQSLLKDYQNRVSTTIIYRKVQSDDIIIDFHYYGLPEGTIKLSYKLNGVNNHKNIFEINNVEIIRNHISILSDNSMTNKFKNAINTIYEELKAYREDKEMKR